MQTQALPPSRLASVCAFGAGLTWVAWAAINTHTHGGLDAGASAVGETTARIGAFLQVSWNLLLLPAALVLHAELEPTAPARMRLVTLAGIVSLLFWAFGSATRTITPVLEVTYLALSAVWWGGLGVSLLASRRGFAAFTLLLAAFTAWDAVLTSLVQVPFSLYVTAAPKLPLSIIWDFALAWTLLPARRLAEPSFSAAG
jgi:hypothetical protein